mgnify:CR=1 FL=1
MRVIAAVYESGKRSGFLIEANGKRKYYTTDEILSNIRNGVDLGITYNNRGFQLTDGRNVTSLAKIERKDLFQYVAPKNNQVGISKVDKRVKGVNIYTGSSLRTYIRSSIDKSWKCRDIVDSIVNYFDNPYKGMMFGLTGLRGTGKTVALLQALVKMNKLSESMYVTLSTDSDIDCTGLCSYLEPQLTGIKYLVIDEATRIKNLIKNGDTLFEELKRFGIAVVLSGTDTLALVISSGDGLFHRIVEHNITFISLAEYERILCNASDKTRVVVSYIKSGGLMAPDNVKDFDTFKVYVNTAIVDNILNTISKNKGVSDFELVSKMSDTKLRSIVFGILYSIGYKAWRIDKALEEICDFGGSIRFKNNFSRVINALSLSSLINKAEIVKMVCHTLGVSEVVTVTQSELNEVLDYLEKLGIIVGLENIAPSSHEVQYFVVNPSVYNQVYSEVIKAVDNESLAGGRPIRLKAVYGSVFESAVIVHAMWYAERHGLEACYFRNSRGREIDLIVYKLLDSFDFDESIYYEIKLTDRMDDAVTRLSWLNNKTYLPGEECIPTDAATVLGRYVIYNGVQGRFTGYSLPSSEIHDKYKSKGTPDELNALETMNKGVKFINGYEFMTNTSKYLGALEK